MARRKIGEALTDANGVATFTYTGEGKGKVQIVAKSGKVESEVKDFYDCILYDGGISTNNNFDDNCWVNTGVNQLSLKRNPEYTNLTVMSGKTSGLCYLNHQLINGETIEMDIFVDGNEDEPFINFRVGSTGKSKFYVYPVSANMNVGEWNHVVFTVGIHDGVTVINMTSDNGSESFTDNVVINRMYFRMNENINEIRFKNFKLY